MQHSIYASSTDHSNVNTDKKGTSTIDTASHSDWHSSKWQQERPSPPIHHSNDNANRSILSSSPSLPTLPPVSSTSLLQAHYFPSNNNHASNATAPNLGTLYQPYPTLPRSTSSSALSTATSHNIYRSPSVNKPLSRPRLTTTLWEDESTLCYQVDSRGICVARRQDNDMINGTKLLNVAGMSRGKRDGILKNERGRIVVKIGAMHLKGVWIPFVRAKALANQFKIIDVLYPIFSDDPASFLYPSHFHQLNRFNHSSSLLSNISPSTHAYSRFTPSSTSDSSHHVSTSASDGASLYQPRGLYPSHSSTENEPASFLQNRANTNEKAASTKSYNEDVHPSHSFSFSSPTNEYFFNSSTGTRPLLYQSLPYPNATKSNDKSFW